VSASVNLPLHHKVQKFSFGIGSPGWSRKKGRKTVVVVVVMAALCNRAGHYIFALWFLSFFLLSFFFSSLNLSGRRLDVYHTSAPGVALVQI